MNIMRRRRKGMEHFKAKCWIKINKRECDVLFLNVALQHLQVRLSDSVIKPLIFPLKARTHVYKDKSNINIFLIFSCLAMLTKKKAFYFFESLLDSKESVKTAYLMSVCQRTLGLGLVTQIKRNKKLLLNRNNHYLADITESRI